MSKDPKESLSDELEKLIRESKQLEIKAVETLAKIEVYNEIIQMLIKEE